MTIKWAIAEGKERLYVGEVIPDTDRTGARHLLCCEAPAGHTAARQSASHLPHSQKSGKSGLLQFEVLVQERVVF